jgi:glycine/D-amino acid oxidase-like deaminating enzyme/nitrite reductase/ring-hydroxylating ferredoxin subunit
MRKRAPAHAPAVEPPWSRDVVFPRTTRLTANELADVCIVGAGIAGMTTAYHLVEAGQSVVVIDDGRVGGGMTAATSAHLSTAIDAGYADIERMHGPEGARVVAASHLAAIDRIEAIVREEAIDCDFERVDGYLFRGEATDQDLAPELTAAHRAGLSDVMRVSRAPLDGFDSGPALQFPRQAQFHPLKYLAGLARAVAKQGGRIYTNTHADQVQGGARARVTAGELTITSRAVVVATNTPVNDLVAVHTKQAAYMTYVVGIRVPARSVTSALFWDLEQPYHYVRVVPDAATGGGDLLLVGGEDHKTGQADDGAARHARLEAWARRRFPTMGDIEYRWAGQVMETIDGLAFIGRNPLDEDNVFIATGDSGQGMTHGTIAGMLLTDLINRKANAWSALYEPSRKRFGAVGEFAKEAVNVMAQYADWVTPGADTDIASLSNDAGAVVRRGLKKYAVYRDEQGVLHELSAVCPHLGCIVRWNGTEKTWDCPCHGSRFDKLGGVINGPANTDLRRLDLPTDPA